jgi:hypothetical protein
MTKKLKTALLPLGATTQTLRNKTSSRRDDLNPPSSAMHRFFENII